MTKLAFNNNDCRDNHCANQLLFCGNFMFKNIDDLHQMVDVGQIVIYF